MKEYLLAIFVLIVVWVNKDHIVPVKYQFWATQQSHLRVYNNSDKDLSDVVVRVWAKPQMIGVIKKGDAKDVAAPRSRDMTEVVVVFKYGNETVERHLGILDEDSNYEMSIFVNYAGVVTSQAGLTPAAAQPVTP
jgi:hypothetical protein